MHLLYTCLELDPYSTLKVVQDPLSHTGWLDWLEPDWEATDESAVLSFDLKRHFEEVGVAALFTELEEPIYILH